MEPLDISALTALKTENKSLGEALEEATKYNKLAAKATSSSLAMLQHLDKAMVNIAIWLTSSNKASVNHKARRAALQELAKDISLRFASLGIRPLSGDFKTNTGENYWLERIDSSNRAGFILSPHFQEWSKNPAAGSFWDYVDQKIKTATEKWELKAQVAKSKGEDAEYAKFCAQINLIKKNVEMCDEEKRKEYLVIPKGGHLELAQRPGVAFSTKEYETHFSGDGWAIFVAGMKNDIYSFSHSVGEFHHSSFFSGAPVKAAGEIVVNPAGKIVVISAKSGHYRPDEGNMRKICKHLELSEVLDDAVVLPVLPSKTAPLKFVKVAEFTFKPHAECAEVPAVDVWNKIPPYARSAKFKAFLKI